MTLPVLGTTRVALPMTAISSMLTAGMPVLLVTMPRILTTKVQTVMVSMMDAGTGIHTNNLGDPLRGRAFRCNLRFAPISAAIPVASARWRSLRAPLAEEHATPCRSSRHDAGRSLRSPRDGASRRTRRGHRLRLGPVHPCAARCRLRRAPARAPPGAVLAALVRALLRSTPALRSAAPCTGVRMTADTAASAFGSVLRTSACGSGRTVRHSFAVAAPLRRLRRRRFPERRCSRFGRSGPPGAALGLTPDAPLVHGPTGGACGLLHGQGPDVAYACAPLSCREKCVAFASLPGNCQTTQCVSGRFSPLRHSGALPCVAFASQTGAPGPAQPCDCRRPPSQLRPWRNTPASRDSRAHGVDGAAQHDRPERGLFPPNRTISARASAFPAPIIGPGNACRTDLSGHEPHAKHTEQAHPR